MLLLSLVEVAVYTPPPPAGLHILDIAVTSTEFTPEMLANVAVCAWSVYLTNSRCSNLVSLANF